MRILYVSHSHPPDGSPLESIGGMQRVSMQLMSAFRESGQVELVEWTLKSPWRGIGRRTAWFLLRSLVEIPKIVARERVEVIWFSSMVTAALAPRFKHLGVPMITINHGQDVTLPVALWQWYLPTVFRSLSASVSVSHATRQQCLNRGLPEQRAHVLPNGIRDDFQSLLPDRSTAASHMASLFPEIEQSLASRRPILLTVGRLMRRKGHAWFIKEVLPLVSSSPIHYLVVGEGPEMSVISELAARTMAETHHTITFLGRQPDEVLHSAYVASDLFIMPNIPVEGDMEGFGVVLLEANLSGTPAVAADLEGIRDVIRDGVNGVKVPALRADLFADAISDLIGEARRGSLEELSARSSAYVQETFLWRSLVPRYVELARSLLSGNKDIQ